MNMRDTIAYPFDIKLSMLQWNECTWYLHLESGKLGASVATWMEKLEAWYNARFGCCSEGVSLYLLWQYSIASTHICVIGILNSFSWCFDALLLCSFRLLALCQPSSRTPLHSISGLWLYWNQLVIVDVTPQLLTFLLAQSCIFLANKSSPQTALALIKCNIVRIYSFIHFMICNVCVTARGDNS